jgi:hypothetical protein
MKQPTAPELSVQSSNLYPKLPVEDYRLQKISEIENTLIKERDTRKALYKKYKRTINITDGVDTTLISSSVILAGIGITNTIMLPLEIVAVVCGSLGVCVKLVRRRLTSKAQKHYMIKTIAESKLNTIKDLISKSMTDGQISENEFKLILDELEKYNKLKDGIHSKQNNGISDTERKKLIEEGKAQAMSELKKKIGNV